MRTVIYVRDSKTYHGGLSIQLNEAEESSGRMMEDVEECCKNAVSTVMNGL